MKNNDNHPKTKEMRELLKKMTYPIVPQGFLKLNK